MKIMDIVEWVIDKENFCAIEDYIDFTGSISRKDSWPSSPNPAGFKVPLPFCWAAVDLG